jgi:uncharacterized membrane protein
MLGLVLAWTSKFIIFLISYILSSRIISVPVALALGFPHYIVLPMVLALDLLQIPLFHHIFTKGAPQIWIIRKFLSKLPSEESIENSRLGKMAQHLGGLGIAFISAAPSFGGGIWSAVLIAQVLKLDYKKQWFYITGGSIIGCLAMVYGYQALFNFIHFIYTLVRTSLI